VFPGKSLCISGSTMQQATHDNIKLNMGIQFLSFLKSISDISLVGSYLSIISKIIYE
jgi:hypothetical protein